MKKKAYLMNSTKIGNKQYILKDSRGFLPNQKFDLKPNWYGGRVTNLAKTDEKGIYLCIEVNRVMDIYIPDLSKCETKTLKAIVKMKGINCTEAATKEQILELF